MGIAMKNRLKLGHRNTIHFKSELVISVTEIKKWSLNEWVKEGFKFKIICLMTYQLLMGYLMKYRSAWIINIEWECMRPYNCMQMNDYYYQIRIVNETVLCINDWF